MRAAQYSEFGGPEVLRVVDLPDPHPGPGQVRLAVRASGVNPTDTKFRQGQLGGDLPQTTGRDVAGVVDEVGAEVRAFAVGDAVFGVTDEAASAAQLALATYVAPIPPSLDFVRAATLPVGVETASRGLDALGVGPGTLLLISGASGGIGSAATQLAVARGARVIGTAGAANQEYVSSLGAEPVVYGDGLAERVRGLAPDGVDRALDVAGSGILPELIALAGGPEHVVTLADLAGAKAYGVHFSTGEDGRAMDAVTGIGKLIEDGRFVVGDVQTFPLDRIADAHRAVETGHGRGKVIVTP